MTEECLLKATVQMAPETLEKACKQQDIEARAALATTCIITTSI